MKRKLLLDSRFATQNTTDNYFTFTFDTIRFGTLKLIHSQFANTHYTVMQGVNDILDLVYNGQSKTITLTPGSYTSTTLVTELQARFTAASISATVTYNSNTFQFVFIFAFNTRFLFSSGVNKSKSCYMVLGFNQTDTQLSTTQTSTNVPVLSGSQYVLIDIKEADGPINTNTTKYDSNYTFVTPFTGVSGAIECQSNYILFDQYASVRPDYYTQLTIGIFAVIGLTTMDYTMNKGVDYPFILIFELD